MINEDPNKNIKRIRLLLVVVFIIVIISLIIYSNVENIKNEYNAFKINNTKSSYYNSSSNTNDFSSDFFSIIDANYNMFIIFLFLIMFLYIWRIIL